MAELSCGTRTPTNPSRLYRSVNASAKTRLSGSTSRRVACSGPRTLRSGRHIVSSGRSVLNHSGSLGQIVADPDEPVEALRPEIDMRDQDDLGEPVGQAPQQIHYGDPPILVERAEDLIQQQQRERLPRARGNHLADGEPKGQVCDVLFTTGHNGPGIAVVEQPNLVVLVQLELGVSPPGKIRQER